MIDIIEEQIQYFIDNELFGFSEINNYFIIIRSESEDTAFKYYKKDVENINFLKDSIYNRIIILEKSIKSVFLTKLIDTISEYTEKQIFGLVAIKLLEKKGLKPNLKKSSDYIDYCIINEYDRISYFNLENLDFNFDKLSKDLYEPYLNRYKYFLDFLSSYSANFNKNPDFSNQNKVFIVHGHNDGIKYELSQKLLKVGLTPIILHEQVSENKTIVEKIEKYSDVKFAIVILSDDDLGKSQKQKTMSPRARQNVVFEMGYFMGILGRKNICCIINNVKLEKPSDIDGIVYLNYNNGDWFIDLSKELRNAGFILEMNNLL